MFINCAFDRVHVDSRRPACLAPLHFNDIKKDPGGTNVNFSAGCLPHCMFNSILQLLISWAKFWLVLKTVKWCTLLPGETLVLYWKLWQSRTVWLLTWGRVQILGVSLGLRFEELWDTNHWLLIILEDNRWYGREICQSCSRKGGLRWWLKFGSIFHVDYYK